MALEARPEVVTRCNHVGAVGTVEAEVTVPLHGVELIGQAVVAVGGGDQGGSGDE
jgi:hypothetical protein